MTYDKKTKILTVVSVAFILFLGFAYNQGMFDFEMYISGLIDVAVTSYLWRGVLLSKKSTEELEKLKEWAARHGYVV